MAESESGIPLLRLHDGDEDTFKPEEDALDSPNDILQSSAIENGLTESPRIFYLFALTCTVGGLQVVWSVILSHGTQFLVSLGLSKSLTALVWIAGPLCGIVVQPIIGAFSDRSHNSWGRRRPFIVAGSIGVILSILCLAWVEEIVEALPSPSGLDSRDLKPLVIVLAVILVYFLNIAIQPVQMGMRALIAENTHHQHQANAWASYLTGVGNIVGYLSGFISLPKLFHLPSLTQFQCLGIVASVALFATVAISCFAVKEHNPRSNARSSGLDFRKIPGKLLDTFRTMPPKIREVCQIQFVAWMGWFPFLYYATTYVADLYTSTGLSRESRHLSKIQHEATQIGTFANLLFASLALIINIIISLHLSQKPSYPEFSSTKTKPLFSNISITHIWTGAHIFFAITMFSTIFVTSWLGATVLIALTGVSWALTLWAPYSIIGNELTILEVGERGSASRSRTTGSIMGIHNVAIAAPQIVAALLSSFIFWLSQELGSEDGTGWALRAGGVSALFAAYLTSQLKT